MKLGASLNFNDLETGLKEYRENGINLFEILYWFDCKPTFENLDRTVEAFKKFGGEIYSVHLPGFPLAEKSYISNVNESIPNINESINPQVFVVHSQKKVQKWPETVVNLEELNDLINKSKIDEEKRKLVVENMPNKAFSFMKSLEKFPEEFNFSCCVDITHYGKKTDELIEFLSVINQKGWLGHIHASDFSYNDVGYVNPFRRTPQKNHLPPGKGQLNWGKVIDYLDSINYKGAMIIETMSYQQSIEGFQYLDNLIKNNI